MQNSQTVCFSCKGLSSSMTDEEQKVIFGEKIEVLLTRVYKKLCYGTVKGKSTFTQNKYTYDKDSDAELLSNEQSRILVDNFVDLIRKYKRMGYEYIERYKTFVDPNVQKDYATFVQEWMHRIDDYYGSKKIIELIKQAQDIDPNKPVVIIKEFILSGVQVEEVENHIHLYKQD